MRSARWPRSIASTASATTLAPSPSARSPAAYCCSRPPACTRSWRSRSRNAGVRSVSVRPWAPSRASWWRLCSGARSGRSVPVRRWGCSPRTSSAGTCRSSRSAACRFPASSPARPRSCCSSASSRRWVLPDAASASIPPKRCEASRGTAGVVELLSPNSGRDAKPLRELWVKAARSTRP